MARKYLQTVILLIGLVWFRSGLDKLASGNFASGLADTLAKFAGKNPYPWYKDFLQNTAIPNSQTFGTLTMWGEVFAAGTLVGCSLLLIFSKKPSKVVRLLLLFGLATGVFLNLTFWLAAGWTSSSTNTLNLLMAGVQIVGILYLFSSTFRAKLKIEN